MTQQDELNLREQAARVERDQAELRKLQAETDKLDAERQWLEAERQRLEAEAGKLVRDVRAWPWLILSFLLGSLVTSAVGHLWR